MIRMAMRRVSYGTTVLGCLFVLLWVCPLQALIVDGVAAIVNDEVILVSQINAALLPFYQEYSMKYEGDELGDKLAAVRTDILQKAIEDRLLLQFGKKVGVEVNDRDVDARIKEIKSRFSSEEEFEQALRREGRNIKSFREQIREQYIIRYVVEKKVSAVNVSVSDEEIADYYQDHRAEFTQEPVFRIQHIFLKTGEGAGRTEERSRAQAEEIIAQLKSGASFEELAAKWSDGPNREEGGDLGLLHTGEILPALEEAALSLKTGEVSGVIQTEGGLYVLKLTEKHPGKVTPLDEVKDDIEKLLVEQKGTEIYSQWIRELKDEAYIEVKMTGTIR